MARSRKPQNPPIKIGAFLKEVRKSRGMTLRDVERITEGRISNGYLSQLENGEIANPSAAMLHRLSAAYAVDYGILMERAGFVPESNVPDFPAVGSKGSSGRSANPILGDLSPDEETQLLRFLGYLRSEKAKKP